MSKLNHFNHCTLIFLVVLLASLSSCYEDDHDDPITDLELIAGTDEFGKSWKIVEIEVAGLGILQPLRCLADNNITYYRNGRYELNEGSTKCDPEADPGLLGQWNFGRSDNSLTISLGDSVKTWRIIYLNDLEQRISARFDGEERIYTLERR